MQFGDVSVLVVEDESFTRMVLVKMLTSLGFRAVHQASDGESGLAAVAAHRPDIVLCDVEMQPVDGVAFLRRLRAGETAERAGGRQTLPVVLMTNRADEHRLAEARAAGADAVLVKPATPDQLRRVLGDKLGAS